MAETLPNWEAHHKHAVDEVYARVHAANEQLVEAIGWARTANKPELVEWLKVAQGKTSAALGHLTE